MTIITVNGYSVENCEDQILLSKLLKAQSTIDNGDGDIDLEEAIQLLDPNLNRVVDNYELENYFANGLTLKDLQRASRIFYEKLSRPKPWFQENEVCLAKGDSSISTGALLLFDNESAEHFLLRFKPSMLANNIDKFKESPFAKELVYTMEANDPSSVIKNIELFMDMPWAKDLAMKMAGEHPYLILKYAYLFMDQDWGEEVVEKAIRTALRKDPELVVDFLYRFIDKPWAKDVMMSVAKKIPAYVMIAARNFINQPWAVDVLMIAKENDPEAAKRILYSQRDLKWAGDKIKKLF